MAKRQTRYAVLIYKGMFGEQWYSGNGWQSRVDDATKWKDKASAEGICEAVNRGRNMVVDGSGKAVVKRVVKDTDNEGFTWQNWRVDE